MFLQKLYQKFPVLLYDFAAIPIAWYFSYWLRYNLHPFPAGIFSTPAWVSLAVIFFVQTAAYYHCKVYRGLWQFVSLNDVMRMVCSIGYTLLTAIPLLYLLKTIHFIPRSILPLYGMTLCLILSFGRMVWRLKYDHHTQKYKQSLTRVLIIGAGQAAEGLIRDLNRSPQYDPIGMADDHLGKQNLEIRGIPVVGTIAEVPKLVQALKIDLIFIAIPSAGSVDMRRIVDFCEASGVSYRTLPSLAALADGRIAVNDLREVDVEDLLGRDEVKSEWHKIQGEIAGKRILVTGAGGSIGSELCRQILKLDPAQLILIDQSEFHLFKMEKSLKAIAPDIQLSLVLASITDAIAVRDCFHRFKPQLVFHAAAYKHVPLLESRARTAVLNNILGTQMVAEASQAVAVEKFILISTDKAVNPSNIMGATKRIAEIYCQNLNERSHTKFLTVRFGNVLGSTGSVVPLFRQQIQTGGPVTVTHPEIERYFMTIPEACHLILQAAIYGQGGEIFVLDMGEPVKIRYLAEQMIRLSGKEVEIIYTGLRPGEKLFEELFHAEEALIPTQHEKLFKAATRSYRWEEVIQTLQLLSDACRQHDEEEIRFLMKNLVPEFQGLLATV